MIHLDTMLSSIQKFILVAFLGAISFLFSPHHSTSVPVAPQPNVEKGIDRVASPMPILSVAAQKINKQDIPVAPTSTSTPIASDVSGDKSTPSNDASSAAQVSNASPSAQSIPSPTQSPSLQDRIVYAHSTIHAGGKTIGLSMQYPFQGGLISGTISGDCSGTISGSYDGPDSTGLRGTGQASCPMGLLPVPVSISYTGQLIATTQANISYTVNALTQTETGSTMLFLSQ